MLARHFQPRERAVAPPAVVAQVEADTPPQEIPPAIIHKLAMSPVAGLADVGSVPAATGAVARERQHGNSFLTVNNRKNKRFDQKSMVSVQLRMEPDSSKI